jgi:hypothetical protein
MSEDNWKHRSKGMACCTCMWFVVKVVGDPIGPTNTAASSTIGRCRRHAPSMTGFPVMFYTDWCGDHKLDENKV